MSNFRNNQKFSMDLLTNFQKNVNFEKCSDMFI